MNIGLYFGSFNPIHTGHLIIANEVAYHENLDQVWFVVSPQNPLKETKTLLNEWHRLHLVQIAIEDNPKLKASSVEFKLPKPSYTSNTLAYLTESYPNHTFSLIMGGDSFCNLTKWLNYQYIIEGFDLIVYSRAGFAIENTLGAKIKIVETSLLEISSTLIREKIKRGAPIDYWLPKAVADEIINNNYYKLPANKPRDQ
jgi:nicotinate-nucleotide adenylyltransferase